MTAQAVPLKLQVGARTLAAIPRRLTRVACSLDDVLAGRVPMLPPLEASADGYLVTSLPEVRLAAVATGGLIGFVRQRYVRFHLDLTTGFDAWFAGLSANARAGLKRRAKKLDAEVRRYATSPELAEFHPLARALSALTYQEQLLDAGLPGDNDSVRRLYAMAAEDRVRAWLMIRDGKPIAYLCCTADGDTLRYDHVGYDPAVAALSPGTVLQLAALRDLFAEGRFARFDFLEGEGQHKRQFASAGTPCVDLLLLRPTIANRATIAVVGGFDAAMAVAKRLARHPALAKITPGRYRYGRNRRP